MKAETNHIQVSVGKPSDGGCMGCDRTDGKIHMLKPRGMIIRFCGACMSEIFTKITGLPTNVPDLYENETNVRGLMTDCAEIIEEQIRETGGCDHSTGVCVCRDVRLVDQIREHLG